MSITADNGAVVGTLMTISQNPGEIFSYELVDAAEQPFRIDGDKLVVAGIREGLDFQVSSSQEVLIPVTIISRDSSSNTFTETFYVTVVGKLGTSFPFRGSGGGGGRYSLCWTKQGGSAQKGLLPLSGWRYIKEQGFHELKYRKGKGKLSCSFIKESLKISLQANQKEVQFSTAGM